MEINKKKRSFFFFIIVFYTTTIFGQIHNLQNIHVNKSSHSYDSTYTQLNSPKNYWLPMAQVITLNFGVWGYHRYISSEGWSDISWESIKNNFENGFEWDSDGYLINQFWHPYHGSNYFNTARANNLDFWEAAPYAVGGSLMWEYFMENEPPSYNDIVNTPVSGIILGEISYRISDLIIDETSLGFERFVREFTSTLLNPMRGLNRLIRGEMWVNGAKKENPDFSITTSLEIHNLFFSSKLNNSKSFASTGFAIDYGNYYDVSSHAKPFDYFSVRAELHFTEKDNIVGILASGVITDSKINWLGNNNSIIGLYKEIDILINTVYKLSATSATTQLSSRYSLGSSIKLENYFGLSAILMGGTNSHYASESGKDYNIGPGASAKIGFKFIFKEFGEFYSNYKKYWIHTLSGARGEEFVGLLNTGVNYQIINAGYLGLDLILYERSGHYINFEDSQQFNSAIRFYFRFTL